MDEYKEKIKQLRDRFLDTAEILDKLLVLQDKADKGENVSDDIETVLGKYMVNLIKINQIEDSLRSN